MREHVFCAIFVLILLVSVAVWLDYYVVEKIFKDKRERIEAERRKSGDGVDGGGCI